jgi:hypothetical protein
MDKALTIKSGKKGPVTNAGTKETQRILIKFTYLGIFKFNCLDDKTIKF